MFQVFDCKFMRGAPTHGESSQNWRDDKCIICDQEVDCVGDTAQESHRARSSQRCSLLKRTRHFESSFKIWYHTMRHSCGCCDICEISSLLLTSLSEIALYRSTSSCRPPTLLTCFSKVTTSTIIMIVSRVDCSSQVG